MCVSKHMSCLNFVLNKRVCENLPEFGPVNIYGFTSVISDLDQVKTKTTKKEVYEFV